MSFKTDKFYLKNNTIFMLDVKEQVDSKAWYLILAHQRMYEDKVHLDIQQVNLIFQVYVIPF